MQQQSKTSSQEEDYNSDSQTAKKLAAPIAKKCPSTPTEEDIQMTVVDIQPIKVLRIVTSKPISIRPLLIIPNVEKSPRNVPYERCKDMIASYNIIPGSSWGRLVDESLKDKQNDST